MKAHFRACVWLLLGVSLSFACDKSPSSATPDSPKVSSSSESPVERFPRRVEKVREGVYCATGYALANAIMVAVAGGKVIIDTTESVEAAREIKAEFDRLVPGPVMAIIYTHTHADHILGAGVFHRDGVDIWAHESASARLSEQFSALAPALRRRAARQFGEGIPKEFRGSQGIGPFLRLDPGPVPPVLYPTRSFEDHIELEIGGRLFELFHAPGETRDQLFVWLPKEKVLFPGDNIYAAFPNLYPPRGAPPRPVREWIASLDKMRRLGPEFLVPSHTGTIRGRNEIYETLTAYRDAIAFLHDSVIRMANEGKGPDDMVRDIHLPPHLAKHPYLQENYGKVSWSVRGIYHGYFGWFDGNPTDLEPLHPAQQAQRLVPLLGGRDILLKTVRQALDRDDARWAAYLADLLLALDARDREARILKAEALETLGRREKNPGARGYLLSSARELLDQYRGPGKPVIDGETLREVPIEVLIRSFPQRLKPDKTARVEMTIAFDFSDTGKSFTFFIRRGVGEVRAERADNADLRFLSTEKDFKDFLSGTMGPLKAMATGRVKVQGGPNKLAAFRSYLIKP